MRIGYIVLVFAFMGTVVYAQTQIVAYPEYKDDKPTGRYVVADPHAGTKLPKLKSGWEWVKDGTVTHQGVRIPKIKPVVSSPSVPVEPLLPILPPANSVNLPSIAFTPHPFNLAEAIQHVDDLVTINGVSIKEIERRALPGVDSQTGFIGKDETIKQVLKDDLKTMYRLGVTHKQLGDDLIAVVQKARAQGGDNFMKEKIIYNGQPLQIGCIYTMGFQTSIFNNNEGWKKSLDNCTWSLDFNIINLRNGLNIRVGGDVLLHKKKYSTLPLGGAVGVIGYIQRYGFFEGGGNKNPYRVDPMILADIMGRVSPADEKKLAAEIEKRKFKEDPASQ